MLNPKWKRRIRWTAILVLAMLLITMFVIWRLWSNRHVAPWQTLRNVVQIEHEGVDEHNAQPLGWGLAMLGRDHEVRQMDFHPQFELPSLEVNPRDLKLDVVPWREGFERITDEHRIIMMMEDHFVSKHRELIGAVLPMARDAGFTHYAAEAVGESAASLNSRGYPVVESGYYVSDPQFGNVLRRAIDLKFEVLGYDFRPFTHEGREEYAASTLADLIQSNPQAKLLVHAGHAHVFKHPTDIGQQWLAAILWEKTGIEPFTIWQWSSMHDGHEYRVIERALAQRGDFVEPVLLMPPPNTTSGLRNVPSVDAILVHPPDHSVAPHQRTTLFPASMQRITGQWRTQRWPVVVAAVARNEPVNAVPLDQVMMRDGEQDFVLWIPASMECDIAVFDQDGILASRTQRDGNSIVIRLE